MYKLNEYMCFACDKGMNCPKHKLRNMKFIVQGDGIKADGV